MGGRGGRLEGHAMYQVKPVDRATIDGWAVREAGLPTRVINSVEAADVRTVGDLRAWPDSKLLRLRSLGRISLDQIHAFFELCGNIEQARQTFTSVREVLTLLLDETQLAVLTARFGLDRPDLVPSGSRVTLQDIGNQTQRTRERVRQVEENGKARLSSRLAALCLQPFTDHVREFIRLRGDAVPSNAMEEMWEDPAFDGLNPCAVTTLISDLYPDRVLLHNGFFSVLDPGTLRQIEQQALELLQAAPAPLAIAELAGNLRGPERREGTVGTVLDHVPDVGATRDGRYYLFTTSVVPLVRELLVRLESPAHYRAVTRAYNERVKPRSRKGAGFILDVLNRDPRCSRVDRGLYRLKP
jgi:hypothetical protein